MSRDKLQGHGLKALQADLAVKYADAATVRTIAQATSALGAFFPPLALISALDAGLGTYGSRLASKRIAALLEDLRALLEGIRAEKVDKAYLASEEGEDLLNRVVRAASQTRDRERIRIYAAVLVGAGMPETRINAESLIGALVELSEEEVGLLQLLDKVASTYGFLEFLRQANQAYGGDLHFLFRRLARSGFITAHGGFSDVAGVAGGYSGDQYVITPTFEKLRELVTLVNAEAFPTAATDESGAKLA